MEKSTKVDPRKLALGPRRTAVNFQFTPYTFTNNLGHLVWASSPTNVWTLILSNYTHFKSFLIWLRNMCPSPLLKCIPQFESEFTSFPPFLRLPHQWSHLLFACSVISIPTLKVCLTFLLKSKTKAKPKFSWPCHTHHLLLNISIFSYKQRVSSIITASNFYIFLNDISQLINWHIYQSSFNYSIQWNFSALIFLETFVPITFMLPQYHNFISALQ